MTSRERLLATMRHQTPDRVPMLDMYFGETLARWRREGHLRDGEDPVSHFGLDVRHGAKGDDTARYSQDIYEDTPEYTIHRLPNGLVIKSFKDHSSAWLFVEPPLKEPSDWAAYKARMVFSLDRVSDEAVEQVKQARARGIWTEYALEDPIWLVIRAWGFEESMMLVLDHPALVADMCLTNAELQVQNIEEYLRRGAEFDAAWVWGDLASNDGPFWSPKAIRELLAPAYRVMFDFCHARGWHVIMHSDGDIRSLLPLLIEVGLQAINPVDTHAGMDLLALKREYGKDLVFIGGIDREALAGSREDIEREIRTKLPPAMEGSGYMYHSDHSIPPTVSYENYQFALDCVRRYGAYAPLHDKQ